MDAGEGGETKIFTWDGKNAAGKDVAAGVYLCMIRLGDETSVQKVAVIR